MNQSGKLLRFEKRGDSWSCYNKGAGYEVGAIIYYPLWESWVFNPSPSNSYSVEMLGDIKRFMEQLK